MGSRAGFAREAAGGDVGGQAVEPAGGFDEVAPERKDESGAGVLEEGAGDEGGQAREDHTEAPGELGRGGLEVGRDWGGVHERTVRTLVRSVQGFFRSNQGSAGKGARPFDPPDCSRLGRWPSDVIR